MARNDSTFYRPRPMNMDQRTRIYYDEELDYCTMFVGEPIPNYGEDSEEGITIFKDQTTDKIIGIGIQDFKEKTKTLKDIDIKLPLTLNFT